MLVVNGLSRQDEARQEVTNLVALARSRGEEVSPELTEELVKIGIQYADTASPDQDMLTLTDYADFFPTGCNGDCLLFGQCNKSCLQPLLEHITGLPN